MFQNSEKIGEKLKNNFGQERRAFHGIAAMISIVSVIIIAAFVTFVYSEQIKKQFFEERSKNLLNVSSKINDMMNTMINDVWSCIDTIDYQVSCQERAFSEEEAKHWMGELQRSVCIKRKEQSRDILIFFDENSKYYMSQEEGFYSGNWHNLSLFTELTAKEGIYSTTLPYVEETQNYLIIIRELKNSGIKIQEDKIKYVAICINTNDFKECFQIDGFENQNFFYILSRDGHRLFRYEQGDSFIDAFNIFNALMECETIQGDSIEKLKESLEEKKNNCSEFVYEGEKYYVSSTALEFKDWFLLMFVPTDVLAGNYDSFLKTTFIFSSVIAVLIIILFVSVITIFLLYHTDQKLMKQQRIANEKLAEAAQIAHNANSAKTEFLSNMSHDIRTPINGIMGMTELALKQENNPEKTDDCLKKIKGATNHLISLVNDILDMSRIEKGKIEITNSNLNIIAIMEECVSIVYGQQGNKQLDFSVDTREVIHPDLFGDDLHLRQILINILGNAVKFTPDGGKIKIIIKETNYNATKAWFEIEIEDTGIGMRPEFLKVIFDPFCQEDAGSRTQRTGTGLGMAITKNIVDLMEGTVQVESEYGVGSKFTVILPFMINSRVQQTDLLEKEKTTISEVKILLVDDNDLNLEVTKELLEAEGAWVTTAGNGKEAVEKFDSSQVGEYDVIIMDIMMPVMDGLQAAKEIRALQRQEAKKIPIIAMTANAFQEDIQKSYQAGMNEHISKPVEIHTIISVIIRLLNNNRGGISCD